MESVRHLFFAVLCHIFQSLWTAKPEYLMSISSCPTGAGGKTEEAAAHQERKGLGDESSQGERGFN